MRSRTEIDPTRSEYSRERQWRSFAQVLTLRSRRFTRTCSTTRMKRSSLSCGGHENWPRAGADRPALFNWAGLPVGGQARPCCAADEDRAQASEELSPNERWHADLRHRKSDMIASKCSRQSKHRRNNGAQDQRPGHGERDLCDRERHAAGGDGNKRRAENPGTTVEGKNAGID